MAHSNADTGSSSAERTLTMARAGREAVFSEMRRNPNMFLIGEDIAKLGGVFGTAVGMADEFGIERVIDTPISETGFVGIATGAAMAGMRPIVEIAFVDFIGVCFNQIFNFAAKTHYMSGGQYKVPMTFMIGYGGGYNDAAQHSQTLFATLAHVPGIRIVTPADAYDAKGLMHTCLRDDNVTVWMVHKRLWGLGWLGFPLPKALSRVPEADYTVPLGQSRVWREGTDLTLVGLGLTVHNSLQAAEQLASQGISAEVLDLRSVVPLDRDGIFRSVAKTGRLVVADEDYLSFGVTSEVLAVVAERDPSVLKAAAVRVAYPDVPVPFSRPMEEACLPSVERILAAARSVMNGSKR
ncbi:MAG TPA: alpha-ketoacid dehydrogenase subunit beta [Steroidobacteraceae bacterium]|jgi:pyruvate dehydrogenase E1 component beta subunit